MGAGGRTEETVVTHFGKAAWQSVPQEAADKLFSGEGDPVELLAAIVTIAKSDLAIFKAFEAAVTESHAKDVAGEIVEHLATLSDSLTMDHPVFAPDCWWHLGQQAGAL